MARSSFRLVQDLVLDCIKAGANINKKNGSGETVLHIAAAKDDVVQTKQLLNAGADSTVCSKSQLTPLQAAFEQNALSAAFTLGMNDPSSKLLGKPVPIVFLQSFPERNISAEMLISLFQAYSNSDSEEETLHLAGSLLRDSTIKSDKFEELQEKTYLQGSIALNRDFPSLFSLKMPAQTF